MADEHKHKEHEHKHDEKHEHSHDEHAHEHKYEDKIKSEKLVETKKENKKHEEKKSKKDFAMVYGSDLPMGMKPASAICNMIRGRTVEDAIRILGEVQKFKRTVKMGRMEAAHQKGRGVAGGKFPIKACGDFIRMVKQLNANAMVNEMPIEACVIFCKADNASRPYKSGGRKFKRANVLLKLELKAKVGGKN